MGLYRRFARSKKGMSTIFGGLFFVILILMGFNVMLWGFVQWDAYNRTIANMSQRDQQAVSENLIPTNATCSSNCNLGLGTLTIIVNNLGGSSVSISNVYIFNTNASATNSDPCKPFPCVRAPYGTSGNIPAGATNFPIQVLPGVPIYCSNNVQCSDVYHITLATSRGRLFNLYLPWRFSSSTIINNNNGNGGQFVTNVGPLAVYFDFKSFNYTAGSSGACSGVAPNTSCSAFCMPATNVLIYVRIANTSSNSSVQLLSSTMMEMQPYSANGFGQFVRAWILDPGSVNPSANSPYSLSNPYTLAPAGPNGPVPASFKVVRFGGTGQNVAGSAALSRSDNWLTFIGIYYLYNGQPQGETIPFMDFQTNAPNCVS